MHLTKYEKSLIAILVVLILFSIFFYISNKIENTKLQTKAIEEKEYLTKITNQIENAQIIAKAISVYNISKDRKLYGKNDEIVLPIASLAKIMTGIVAMNIFNPDDIVMISKEALSQKGDNSLFLNENWNVYDLLRFSLVTSSNDGVYAISENQNDFIDRMNEKAKKIGLTSMNFLNQTGLDIDEYNAGAYGTAFEINKLSIFAITAYPEIFSSTKESNFELTSLSNIKHEIQNTNLVTKNIPNLIFSKTGNTNLAGGNLSIIFKNTSNDYIAITILGSTIDGRFTDIEKLVNIFML